MRVRPTISIGAYPFGLPPRRPHLFSQAFLRRPLLAEEVGLEPTTQVSICATD